MLVVSTVEPMALGGEEAREGQEGGEAREAKREAKEGRREEEGLAMESPSKRIRLSSAEEEPGPCDSQDDSAQVGGQTILWEAFIRMDVGIKICRKNM